MQPLTLCKFCHGKNIEIEDDHTATRSGSFSNGIVFSAEPHSIGEKVTVEIRAAGGNWSGAIRYGFTNKPPGTIPSDQLPPFAMPNLSSQPGYWAKGLHSRHNEKGNILSYYVTKDREVYSFVNNENISTDKLSPTDIDVSKPVWVLLDVYGTTTSIALRGEASLGQDGAPAEILSRGPEAMEAFKQAATNGTKPIFRTRLMLVGQDRVGKTSLKRSLTGQGYNSGEVSTDGIDTMDACEINIQNATGWKVQEGEEQETSKNTVDDSSSLQDSYTQALALNIAKVLWNKKKRAQEEKVEGSSPVIQQQEDSSHSKEDSKDDVWITSETDSSSDNAGDKQQAEAEAEQLEDLAKSLDEETFNLVTSQVERLLKDAEDGKTDLLAEKETEQDDSKKIVLSIWDFAGQSVYYTTHQVFLSSRAVYIIVFNLTHELDAPAQTQIRRGDDTVEYAESEFTNLDFMDFWMRSIHAYTAENRSNALDNTMLSPPIFVVGTHRASLSSDPVEQARMVEEKFLRIRQNLLGKPYLPHIIPSFYAVENNIDEGDDEQVTKLRKHVEEVASKEPYMGEHIPLRWLRFQQKVADLVSQGINYMSLDNMSEVASSVGISSEAGLQTMLQFYHDLGIIIYYGGPGASDSSLRNTVILRPQWLVDIFRRVITIKDIDDKWSLLLDAWTKLDEYGILQDQLLDHMWHDVIDQKEVLVGLMEKFDLLCERQTPSELPGADEPSQGVSGERSYYVPSRLRECPDQEDLMAETNASVAFYITFNGFLPDGLFHRILTRAVRWSQEQGGREPRLFFRQARFFLNDEHDALLEMAPARLARIKVMVLSVDIYDAEDQRTDAAKQEQANQEACAKVRHFLDSTLADLRQLCMKRVRYQLVVACPCNRRCVPHGKQACLEDGCLHFLSLEECLSKKVAMCESRRIRTNVFQKWFPSGKPAIPAPLPVKVSTIETIKEEDVPSWVRVAAKLLNSGTENADWLSLAYRLGYKNAKIQKLTEDEPNPALCILLDWFQTSGNTALSVEMLLSYLEQMKRDDVIEVIEKGQDVNKAPPTVFISYNWGIQEDVTNLRDYLERTGFPCWMDIGQMGGGDQLYNKIYEGIHNAKVRRPGLCFICLHVNEDIFWNLHACMWPNRRGEYQLLDP
ncbi:uncharacterized protein LOC755988 isoform X2 [Strongylocentrotus purpuratus]|uniref:non-specific serine/threonine protein kinase n=1 Tax=Strongylocentrotus purpuratus TaxID=7668 RepID=A0A7M7PK17_STRPU|nr:uncharacterized protein LOC755988 isoform X2 [Strongylocentrotus purpuratus]